MQNILPVHKAKLENNLNSPLLILVHGRAGNVDVMWTFKSYLPTLFNIISLQAPLPDPLGGYSWWMVDKKPDTKMIQQISYGLTDTINYLIAHYTLKPSKILSVGFSQGSALLSTVIQNQPDFFKAVALLAGFVCKMPQIDSFNPDKLPKVYMAHGLKDQIIPIDKAISGRDFLQDNGYVVEFITDDVTHKVGTKGMRGLKNFLLKFA